MTPDPRNPQKQPMADPSMVRTLDFQARAIWPQEREIIARYGLTGHLDLLDVGCGTGELLDRIANMFPDALVTGVDVEPAHLAVARQRLLSFEDRVKVLEGDAFNLDFADHSFDLTLCRHLLQAVPEAGRVIDEMIRVTRPGGRLHILAEDYGMMHFHPTAYDTDRFWQLGAFAVGDATGTDLRIGRKAFAMLRARRLLDITVDHVVVDTTRVPRAVFSGIWRTWRDGYTDFIADHSSLTRDEVLEHFEDMIRCIDNPDGYAVWHVPVLSAIVP